MLDAVNRPQILQHVSKSLNITIYDCKWIPRSARFVVLGAHPRSTGSIQVFELDGADVSLRSETETPSGLKCGTFGAASPTDRLLATGGLDGCLSLWNLEELREPVAHVEAHIGTVNAVDGCGGKPDGHGPPEIATCGRDGCVRVFDARQIQTPVAAFEPTDGSTARECWSVAFGDSYNDAERCILAGYENGDVKLFDLRTNQIRWETNVKNGVCGVEFDRPDIEMNKFVVSCLESQIHAFDARTQHPQKGFAKVTMTTEFKSTCWAPKHLPQNRELFAVTHGDGTVALFKYRYPPQRKLKVRFSKRVREAHGSLQDADGTYEGVAGRLEPLSHRSFSSQPVSCFAWSPDKEGLFVCGALDQCIRVGIVTKLNKI